MLLVEKIAIIRISKKRKGNNLDKNGLPQVIDIWMEKIRRGWKIEDFPASEAVKKELRKRLKKDGG